jgi:hypothetical protein
VAFVGWFAFFRVHASGICPTTNIHITFRDFNSTFASSTADFVVTKLFVLSVDSNLSMYLLAICFVVNWPKFYQHLVISVASIAVI